MEKCKDFSAQKRNPVFHYRKSTWKALEKMLSSTELLNICKKQPESKKCFAVFDSKVSLGAHVFRNHRDNQKKEILSNDKIKKEKVQSIKREPEEITKPRDVNVKTEMMAEITRKDPDIRSQLLKMMSMKAGFWVCHQCGAEKKDKGHACM